ncbi:DUF1800 domain-containing protein [Granulosicoccus sp. 3-233]|uniref:DUF1800 domain-containing protein n=1 Tax=Granulosicoccus sp. 3-233 TaxID=3417969 RepID=UPI003D3441EB
MSWNSHTGQKGGMASLILAGTLLSGYTCQAISAQDPTNSLKWQNAPVFNDAMLLTNREQANRFLRRASFGATLEEIDALVGHSASAWLAHEMGKESRGILPDAIEQVNSGKRYDLRYENAAVWDQYITADDQLRQRMHFALSQILVVSNYKKAMKPLELAYYSDLLSKHALGNYKDLIHDITFSPAMAKYLTYLQNKKGDPRTGRMPDENYARELLQLFTLGLHELNMDGSVVTDADDKPVPIYSNEDIVGLARVFTGFSLAGDRFERSRREDAYNTPLQLYPEQHSTLEKSFLGLTIPENTGAQESVDMALDHILSHPNLAPFVAKQLIQRFTQSDPEPAYIERVARAFDSGSYTSQDNILFGSGERGDLQATIAAILLDKQFFDDIEPAVSEGKVREPVLRFVHFARAFSLSPIKTITEAKLKNNPESTTRLSQGPFRAPSVFNFYRPGFLAPGSLTAREGIAAPEFQIVNESYVVGYANTMLDFVWDRTTHASQPASFTPDYSALTEVADEPDAVAEHLNELLFAGEMTESTRATILDALTATRITARNADTDRLTRARLAVFIAVTAPEFAIEK